MREIPEMVERVARAICDVKTGKIVTPDYELPDNTGRKAWELCVDEARAAIQTMMEPTEAMIDAGVNAKSALYDEFERQGIDTRTLLVANHPAGTIYQAMVREALKP